MKRDLRPSVQSRNAVQEAMAIAAAEQRPVRILFVCLGNICRSPAAEGMMRSMAKKAGVELELDSAGFYGGHAGDLPDSRMRSAAFQRGLRLDHRSRTIRPEDFEYFDLIIGMDAQNMRNLRDASPTIETDRKILAMADFAKDHPNYDYIPDPYYEGMSGFELVLNLLEDACSQLLKQLK